MSSGDPSATGAAEGRLALACTTPFDRLPADMVVRAFGVEYGHVRPPEGGDLYVTRFGWPNLVRLLPGNWYADGWYATHGERLQEGSGTVYHVKSRPVVGRSLDMLVKFSRVAQEVSIVVATTFPENFPPEMLANARFNSPMEEFGLVMELRRGAFGPLNLRILTQRPLAIYAPPDEVELWQLGRDRSCFHGHLRLLAEDQANVEKAIELDIRRVYVLLYGWIKGRDAEQKYLTGELPEAEFRSLTPRVVDEIRRKGFRVLDNKPKHFILRRRSRGGGFLRRSGGLVYGLVDFELLQRTAEHQHRFRTGRRQRFWHLQSDRRTAPGGDLPSHLNLTTVFGVTYLFGTTPDGGKVWVVGRDPGLFDYFLPERWRRTPRVKLSPSNEVYRTRTRDNVHLVYRRSLVGSRPRVDPLVESGSRIREHGFNSPFEEIAIAERLRQMGISTTHPRAICRTGHHSTKASYLRDERRFADHAQLMTPEDVPVPILSPNHDYYTLWDYFRGIRLAAELRGEPAFGVVDLAGALEEGLLSAEEYELTVNSTLERLQAIGFRGGTPDHHELVVWHTEDGALFRESDGRIEPRLCIDALTAHEYDLLSELEYRGAVRKLEQRLRAVDCEKLDLSGKHMLLSMSPDGRFDPDESGDVLVTLCNFDLIRGLYRPFR